MGLRSPPPPFFLAAAPLALLCPRPWLERSGTALPLLVVADQQVLPLLPTARGLHEVTKLPIEHPQARPTDDLTRLLYPLGPYSTLGPFPIRIGCPCSCSPLTREKGPEELPALDLARRPPRR